MSDVRLLSDETLGARLAAVIAGQPDVEALISRHQGIRWTYAELGRQVERAALGLLALGIRKGDRVGIWSPTCAEWTCIQFATARIGAILVNINPAYRAGEMAYAMSQAGVRLLISARSFKTSNYLEMIAGARRELPRLERVVGIGRPASPGERPGGPDDLWWDELAAASAGADPERLAALEADLDCGDPINIQYTSGTTGRPKGATLTHHNILNNARLVAGVLGYTRADRVCIPVPLYHCFGMGIGNAGCIASGSTLVYPSESFDALSTLQAIASERCTSVYGVPTMFIAELEHPRFREFDLSSLRTGLMGGAPCPIEVMKRVIQDMHAREICIVYGMTETSPVSFMTRPGDPIERRVGTVGTVVPHTEARIVEPGTGKPAAPGAPGEVHTRGYLVMRGYWEDPQGTAQAIDADGWMRTGDLGILDSQGYLNIVGRLKDMVIRGGENIYPVEIEEALFRHPAIASAQVIGVPDERFGEELMAWVVLRAGAQLTAADLQAYCRERLAHFKTPRYVKFVSEYPLTVTGKVQKFRMREMAIRELGLEKAAGIRTA